MCLTINNAKKNLKPVLKGEEEEKGGGRGQGIKVVEGEWGRGKGEGGRGKGEGGRGKNNYPNEFLVVDKNFHGEGNPRARTQNNWF